MSSFKTLTSVLKSAWRRPKQRFVEVPPNAVTIYERTPPVWARWGYALIAINVMASTSAVEVIWNTWTMPDPAQTQEQEPEQRVATRDLNDDNSLPVAVLQSSTTHERRDKWTQWQIIPQGSVLVPVWKRALASSAFIFAGVVMIANILATRSRIVRRLSYIRPSSPPLSSSSSSSSTKTLPRTTTTTPTIIFMQTADHPTKYAYSYALKDCWLSPSGNKNQMLLQVKGYGKWVLDVRKAKMAGKDVPHDNLGFARNTMFKTWKSIEGSRRSLS